MIKPKQVPKEALVAYQRAFKNGGGPADAISAALNAWPGMSVADEYDLCAIRKGWITLPQEDSDE